MQFSRNSASCRRRRVFATRPPSRPRTSMPAGIARAARRPQLDAEIFQWSKGSKCGLPPQRLMRAIYAPDRVRPQRAVGRRWSLVDKLLSSRASRRAVRQTQPGVEHPLRICLRVISRFRRTTRSRTPRSTSVRNYDRRRVASPYSKAAKARRTAPETPAAKGMMPAISSKARRPEAVLSPQ